MLSTLSDYQVDITSSGDKEHVGGIEIVARDEQQDRCLHTYSYLNRRCIICTNGSRLATHFTSTRAVSSFMRWSKSRDPSMGRKSCNFHRTFIFYSDNSIDTWSCFLVHFTITTIKFKLESYAVCLLWIFFWLRRIRRT